MKGQALGLEGPGFEGEGLGLELHCEMAPCLQSLLLFLPVLQRLAIAELLDDKVAARRAYSNLGNAQVFLGKYAAAAQHYL